MAIQEIDVEELAALVAGGARVIDVREPHEYVAGHVPGAVSVPLTTLGDHLDDFRGDGPAYVVCHAGGRSRRACELVELVGIEAVNVSGGTGAWIASGRQTVPGDRPT